jgi:hypothetical protein
MLCYNSIITEAFISKNDYTYVYLVREREIGILASSLAMGLG